MQRACGGKEDLASGECEASFPLPARWMSLSRVLPRRSIGYYRSGQDEG
jgi:hypothetical protein